MRNQPGRGPTRNDKTTERMAQERRSPGATTVGVPGADTSTVGSVERSSSRRGSDPDATNTAARRGDAATEGPSHARRSPPTVR
jgi:hypothetical protein